jgi:hypothetical protein
MVQSGLAIFVCFKIASHEEEDLNVTCPQTNSKFLSNKSGGQLALNWNRFRRPLLPLSTPFSLIRERSTILSDIDTDMTRDFYSHDVYSIADGAGNVVVSVVAWARETIEGMTVDRLWRGRRRSVLVHGLVSISIPDSFALKSEGGPPIP